MSKINVYSSSASNAIKVFDANSSGVKPDNAILVTTGTEPSNAIQINIGEKNWSSIAVNFGGQEPWPPEPPEPTLPPYTIRFRFRPLSKPYFSKGTLVLVDETNNIWDLTYENTNWSTLFAGNNNLIEVIAANTERVTSMASMFVNCSSLMKVPLFDTTSVTDMRVMFGSCSSLASVPLFDTSSVTNMASMFANCSSLMKVPLFDTTNVSNMANMFNGCTQVQTGALALYQHASSQVNPPPYYGAAFRNCGSNTETGAAELAQIPDDWK